MPLYEYECDDCGNRFERIQRFSDPPEKVCPSCGGLVQKLPSSPAIQFKGSGWYVTDYAKKSGAPAGDGAGKGDGSASAKDGKKDSSSKDASPSKSSAGKGATASSSPVSSPSSSSS